MGCKLNAALRTVTAVLSVSTNLCDQSIVWVHWSSCTHNSLSHILSPYQPWSLWSPDLCMSSQVLDHIKQRLHWILSLSKLSSQHQMVPGIFRTQEIRAPVQRGQSLSLASVTGMFLFHCRCLRRMTRMSPGLHKALSACCLMKSGFGPFPWPND